MVVEAPVKDENRILHSKLFKSNRQLFMTLLSYRLNCMRKLSFLVEERLTNPRVWSKDLTNKLIKRYENLSSLTNIQLEILKEANSNGKSN